MRDARTSFPEGEAPRRPSLPPVHRSPGHAAFFELDDDRVLALDHADPGERVRAVGYLVGLPRRSSL